MTAEKNSVNNEEIYAKVFAQEEPNLTRDEAIALINLPDERLGDLMRVAGNLRTKYK